MMNMGQGLAVVVVRRTSVQPLRTLVVSETSAAPCAIWPAEALAVLAGVGVAVEWPVAEHRPELPVTGLGYGTASSSAVQRALGEARTLLRPERAVVYASQDEGAQLEARGGSEHVVIHATSGSKECRFDETPATTGAPKS